MMRTMIRITMRIIRLAGIIFFALMTLGSLVSINKPSDIVVTALFAGITFFIFRIRLNKSGHQSVPTKNDRPYRTSDLAEAPRGSVVIGFEMPGLDGVHDNVYEDVHEKNGIKRVLDVCDLTKMPRKFVMVDLETTGLNVKKDRIIEIAIVKYIDGAVVSKYHQLINPGIPIPATATIINGITDDMVQEHPQIDDVVDEIFNKINSELVCGYNIAFDLRFLSAAFASNNMDVDCLEVLDVMDLVKHVIKPEQVLNMKLTTIKDCFNINTKSHRALDDCEATFEVMKKCFQIAGKSGSGRKAGQLKGTNVETIAFLVQGSQEKPYEVTFKSDGKRLVARCTCTAARNGLHCKHRLLIMKGKTNGIISDNKDEVATVTAFWLPGTQVEEALRKVEICEAKVKKSKKPDKRAKENLASAKQVLALAMEGVEPSALSVGLD